MSLIWQDFKDAYSNKYLLKWSIWWAFATCGNFQVGNFIQPLWENIAPMDETETLYNGAVEATQTLLSKSHVEVKVLQNLMGMSIGKLGEYLGFNDVISMNAIDIGGSSIFR